MDQVQVPYGSSIEVTFDTENDAEISNRAHQTVVILGSPKLNLEIAYPVSVRVSGKAKVTIPYKNIPEVLMSEEAGSLTLELVVAGFDQEVTTEQPDEDVEVEHEEEVEEHVDETNEETGEVSKKKVKKTVKKTRKESKPVEPIVETVKVEPLLVKVSDNVVLTVVSHQKPERFGIKPEIHHVFRPPPHTLNAKFAAIITLCVTLSIIFLMHAWLFFAEADFIELSTAFKADAASHIGFVVTIFAFEYTFFKYYRGASIFETLTSFAILGPPAIYFGSRALREVQARRAAGKI